MKNLLKSNSLRKVRLKNVKNALVFEGCWVDWGGQETANEENPCVFEGSWVAWRGLASENVEKLQGFEGVCSEMLKN